MVQVGRGRLEDDDAAVACRRSGLGSGRRWRSSDGASAFFWRGEAEKREQVEREIEVGLGLTYL